MLFCGNPLVSLLVGVHMLIDILIPRIPGIDSVIIAVDYSTVSKPINKEEIIHFSQLPGATAVTSDIQAFGKIYERQTRDSYVPICSATTNDPELRKLKVLAGKAE